MRAARTRVPTSNRAMMKTTKNETKNNRTDTINLDRVRRCGDDGADDDVTIILFGCFLPFDFIFYPLNRIRLLSFDSKQL